MYNSVVGVGACGDESAQSFGASTQQCKMEEMLAGGACAG